MHNDGAQQVPQISHEHFSPGAVDATYQEVVRSSHFGRPEQTAEVLLLEFDVLRRQAESGRATGGAFPYIYSPPPYACKMHPCRRTRSPRFLPEIKARWSSMRWRNRCVDFLDHVEVPLVKASWPPWSRICSRKKRVSTQHGYRAARQKGEIISRGRREVTQDKAEIKEREMVRP